ncbi:beta-ketoacyl synthase N-terminal-like domain-containing protein [Micromonospora sp. NPDC049559]|uniref:beta-ketoacyl synthase N-terminal-like domain-containing protein n=1 Tax=Micromonospora sp. NPDC049559 TaxID=3155923 RepID=UPI0034244D99
MPADRDSIPGYPAGPGYPTGGVRLCGLGLRLAGVRGPADLAAQLTGRVVAPRVPRLLTAEHSDLEPVERCVHGPVEVRMPDGVPPRGLRNLPRESLLSLAAAAEAAATATGPQPGVGPVAGIGPVAATGPLAGGGSERDVDVPDGGEEPPGAVVWVSSTAGLTEYAGICVEAAVLEPGLSSPMMGPAAAFNAPAATVSIRLGLRGPNETLTGGAAAGIGAFVEAVRILATGEASEVLLGGSATVSRWSVVAGTGAELPAEGAVCLALGLRTRDDRAGDGAPGADDRATGDAPDAGRRTGAGPVPGDVAGIHLGRFRRVGLDPARPVEEVRRLVAEFTRPAAIVVSTPDAALAAALRASGPGPAWHVERTLGDFGAAGGLLAVAGAAALVSTTGADVLALAVEPSGYAALVEVGPC